MEFAHCRTTSYAGLITPTRGSTGLGVGVFLFPAQAAYRTHPIDPLGTCIISLRRSFMARITDIHALEILDSRGNPTIEVEVLLDDGSSVGPPSPPEPRREAARPANCGTATRLALAARVSCTRSAMSKQCWPRSCVVRMPASRETSIG